METFLVGGAVRDKLLGLEPHEYDWVVVGATPAELESLGYQQVGKDFPVFLHPITRDEYALARTERKSGTGYKGFQVEFDPSVTLEQDLRRRDLTINAIAETPDGTLIDPFNGQHDISQRQLRHVSEAFTEDPLRVLRIARFLARFAYLGFDIADNTWQLLQQMVGSGELAHLTPERVWKEWQKSLSTSDPDRFLGLLLKLDAIEQVFTDLKVTHTLLNQLQAVAQQTSDTEIRFASVFIGQPQHFDLKRFCQRLAIPNRYRDAAQLATQQDTLITATTVTVDEYFQLLNDIDYWRRPQRLHQFLQLRAGLNTQHSQLLSHRIEQAAGYAAGINALQLQQQGYQGKELGLALKAKRRQAFQQHLESI